MNGTPAQGPLVGLKLLDMATMMAAPWAATFLADFGADVIKLEHPKTGDHARNFGLSKDGEPVFWKTLARNKHSVTLDLKAEQGKKIVKQLVQEADIVIENFRPGTLAKWGLGYESLAVENSRLIMLSVTGYGQDGPYASRPGFGTLLEAMSGFAHTNGQPEGPPTLPAIPLADGVAGAFGAMAILAAVFERERSGRGQHIDMSLFEPLARLHEGHLLEYSVLGQVRERLGNRSLSSAPRNAYRASDGGWVALSASAQPIFERLMNAIGRPELVNDPRFLTNHDRITHSDDLDATVGAWIAERRRDEVIATLSASGAAVGPIYNTAELLDDPHVKARGSFETHQDSDFGEVTVPGMVARFSRTPGAVWQLGEKMGASTRVILGELGYTEDDLEELAREGVI